MASHELPAVALHLLLQNHLTLLTATVVCSLFPLSAGAFTSNHTATMPVRCLPDQASALLRLKRSFATTNYSVIAFRSWRAGTDCCSWAGVSCSNSDGWVTSLDLGDRGLESRGLDPALFDLVSLNYLNLAYNDFKSSQLPSSGFQRLLKLTHLNLSSSSFSGLVPACINKLANLVSLDLSNGFDIIEQVRNGFLLFTDGPGDPSELVVENLGNLIHNLTNLRELHLGMVDLSNSGSQWCNIIAKSCPKLQVLSLPFCLLSGPICSSLSTLDSLSVIDLQLNHLSGPFPDFFAYLSNLTVLQLRHNHLQGWMSPAIFRHKKLVTVDIYYNLDISGHLPDFSNGSRLENLNVGRTNFSSVIPASLGNLTSMKRLGLAAIHFSGELPSSIGNLKSLTVLEVSGMGIGAMPSWVANLTSLTTLRFDTCGLSGSLPSFIGNLRFLKELLLCDCGFTGEIPPHFSNLTQLQVLLLYSNNLVGPVELTFFSKFPNLIALDLYYNNLVVLDGEYNSTMTSFPTIFGLGLAGCRMSKFPNFLRHQHELDRLSLADNEIHGAIPQWAWETWNELSLLFLGNNKFTRVGYYAPFLPVQLEVLDLSNNMFEGPIPIPQGSAGVLDYSNNRFSSVPHDFSYHLSDVSLFDASGNNLSGNIPPSFCARTSIQLLDLSHNSFSGPIPSCLMENVNGMQSLNLKENQLSGEFPDNIKECSFEALDFSGNWIEGKLPRSLSACKDLEILDVGSNQISDSFPCWMSALPRLEVLVLRSNRFSGQVAQSLHEEENACAFPSATIVDLSSNNFSGPLPRDHWFESLESMIFRDPDASLVMDHGVSGSIETYKYTAAITYKGHDTAFERILTTLVFIDFSSNGFSGGIPEAVGELVLLHGLNISHNSLTGMIPSQLGNLSQLEALDLSSNQLSGEIPRELTSLDFLTALNLSDNQLVGSIPESPHFLTFSNGSFTGNDGLCGSPLSIECINATPPNAVPHHSEKDPIDIRLFLFAGMGFGFGFAIAIVVAWGIPIRKRT